MATDDDLPPPENLSAAEREEIRQQYRAEMQDTIEEEVQERFVTEESADSGVFTHDHLIEEMASLFRNHYGRSKKHVRGSGHFDLVDLWITIPYMIEEKYDERFLRRSAALGWSSRMNRHGIPNKFLFSMKALDRALREGLLHPTIDDKVRYFVEVRLKTIMFVLGPPIGYWNRVGPSHKDARHWAMYLMGEIPSDAQRYSNRIHTLRTKIEILTEKLQNAQQAGDTARARQYLTEIDELKDEYELLLDRLEEEEVAVEDIGG